MPSHLSGSHDIAVSRPYGNNASACGSMGRREAVRERGVGSRSCCIHSVSLSLRPPSHRDLPSHSPKHQHLHITRIRHRNGACDSAECLHWLSLGSASTPFRLQKSLQCRKSWEHHHVQGVRVWKQKVQACYHDIKPVFATRQWQPTDRPASCQDNQQQLAEMRYRLLFSSWVAC
jgi:hypothetical protein